jgi:hypothetical protein
LSSKNKLTHEPSVLDAWQKLGDQAFTTDTIPKIAII